MVTSSRIESPPFMEIIRMIQLSRLWWRKSVSLAPKGTGGKNINIYFLNKFLPDFLQKDTCIYASVTDFQNPFTG